MNVLIFEYKNFGIEDIKDTFSRKHFKYKVITSELMRERKSPEFDELFEKEIESENYDCVFTFNYSPVISNNCNARNIPYISFVYDSPQVLLYSYTIINPCNYVFIFDSKTYMELKNEGINTVYYAPLCANTVRLDSMLNDTNSSLVTKYTSDISFVGSLYNEAHNLYDRMLEKGLSNFSRGYLDAAMNAQMKVYGYFFLEDIINGEVLKDMLKCMPVSPNPDGVETVQYIYAHYFLARKLASRERQTVLNLLSSSFGIDNTADIKLYTPNPTPELSGIKNMGSIDYYNDMPYVFRNSKINLNISLRSIRSGIPLRGIDIMGAKGFLMSNYQEDFYNYFIPGEDCVLFESHEDLINKCNYYLKHESERKQIAENGYGKVSEHHTFDVRIDQIMEIVFS